MILNDFNADVYSLCRKEKRQKQEIARELGISNGCITQTINGQIINKGYVKILDALGYDIKVEYIKRD